MSNFILNPSIHIFLDTREISRLMLLNKHFQASIQQSKAVELSVWRGDLPSACRARFWMHVLPISQVQEDVRKILQSSSKNLYQDIHHRLSQGISLENSDLDIEFTREEILKDLHRTFFVSEGSVEKTAILNVLIALAYVKPSIGYCQGMSFVAGAFVCVCKDEEQAFWALLAMIRKNDLENMFMPGVPDLLLREHQMLYYIRVLMPDLNSHFRRSQISPALFISRWLMTLYASYLPLDTLLPVWDCFFTSGWKVMLKIGIAILRELKDRLIILELEEFATFLRKEARKQHFNYKELLQTAQSTHISTKELKKIEDQFYIAQAKIKLEAAERSHTYTEGELEALRWAKKEFDKFDAPTKQDVATFQQKIEKLDRDLEGIHKHFITITMEVQHIENEIENLCEKKGIYVRTLKDMEKKYKKSKRRAKNLLTKLLPNRAKNLNVVGLPQALPEISVKCEAGQPENPSDCIREEDIVKCKDKLAKIEEELKLLQTMYKDKHSAYLESKNRVEEMKLKKKCYSEQLADFITMCQIKKEDTLLQLSKHLDPKKFTNLHAV